MHDPIISRVSDSFGLVKNMEYSKLKKKFKDITTLEDITNKYQNQIIFLELKDKIDVTKHLNNNNTYYITSFNYNNIKDLASKMNNLVEDVGLNMNLRKKSFERAHTEYSWDSVVSRYVDLIEDVLKN